MVKSLLKSGINLKLRLCKSRINKDPESPLKELIAYRKGRYLFAGNCQSLSTNGFQSL